MLEESEEEISLQTGDELEVGEECLLVGELESVVGQEGALGGGLADGPAAQSLLFVAQLHLLLAESHLQVGLVEQLLGEAVLAQTDLECL